MKTNQNFQILTNSYSFPSAKLLRDSFINLGFTNKILVTSDENKIKSPVLIRYGNSSEFVDDLDLSLNSPEFIKTCSDKFKFSELMRKLDLATPEYFKTTTNLKFPLLIRTSLRLSGGRGIFPVENEEQFDENWKIGSWWTPFLKTDFELRIHICGSNIIKIFKKCINPDQQEQKFPIRNNEFYHFKLVNKDKYPKVNNIVKKLSEIFSNNIYALDIGWDSQSKKYILFEANSAPGLNENTANLYAKYILGSLQERDLIRWDTEKNAYFTRKD